MTPSALPNKAAAAAHLLAQAANDEIQKLAPSTGGVDHSRIARPSAARLESSWSETPICDLDTFVGDASEHGTILYLAYGSNLSKETFLGLRGIRPVAQVNVQVPSLRLTFDLPGLPYKEPCFANSGLRDPNNDPPSSLPSAYAAEKESLLANATHDKYRKDRWHKGLIGVVYEVTPRDFAKIIATEGGGSSYQDILVDCYPFASADPASPVPSHPSTTPFKAHTLFAPAIPTDESPGKGGRFRRPDTSYAQPSARYKKLITDGAAELGLPDEYQAYLHSIHPYTITTLRQRTGQAVFMSTWALAFLTLITLSKYCADENGRVPGWLGFLMSSTLRGAWLSYDYSFHRAFGDGERTLGDDGTD